MVVPTVPEFVEVKEVGCLVLFIAEVAVKAISNAEGVKENTMRVGQNIEFMLLQPVGDMLGEARPYKEDIVGIEERAGQGRDIERKRELHKFDCFNIFEQTAYRV